MKYLGPILAIAGVGLIAMTATAAEAKPKKTEDASGKKWPKGQTETRGRLKAYGTILEQALSWPELSDFLDAAAFTESRWILRPKGKVPKPGTKKAVGPYQLKPQFAAGHDAGLEARFMEEPTLLEDPAVATAGEVAMLWRNHRKNPSATRENVRASLLLPVFVHGRPTQLIQSIAHISRYNTLAKQQAEYDGSVKRFHKAAEKIGKSVSWTREKMYQTNFGSWNGEVRPLLPLLGVILL